ncbi:MAG: alpha-amylase [Haliscomenobacteraceae bacterium CHB4]|nr:Beta/alpha-amylase [Saprospiraceae bacterium]MCE7921975.1 alpha-amylase [Haliscomenobacteraceae bacterium CHB4]
MKSVKEIELFPKPGKKYWKNCQREWREEFIYFLLVDRFHDSAARNPLAFAERHSGFGSVEQLVKSCGGTLKGITEHLEYIKNLGCTALWLSPVFENNTDVYHGYAIQNYLDVDKRWGTKEDLEALVDAAHELDMRVFLDIVLDHSGDNWFYPDGNDYFYFEGERFPFGGWRYEDRPLPVELRNPELYNRQGQIRNFDAYPETRDGDFCNLKAFRSDNSPEAEYVNDLLINIHCYWIRETDIDGFRLDAVKHMDEIFISRFCSAVREYAYSLGKKNFFFFGELIGPDEISTNYFGPKTAVSFNDKNVYYGLDSVLDFPLYGVLSEVIKGVASPERLIERYSALQRNALSRGEYGEFLVTFVDNHDQVGEDFKHRFGYGAAPEQIIAAVGFLLCAIGMPCIYYGTEQGLDGHGEGDWTIRECMFDPGDRKTNVHNPHSLIYRSIAAIARVRQNSPELKFGRMFIREISADGQHFHLPECEKCTLAFSRILFNDEILVVYNSSVTESKEEYVLIDFELNENKAAMECLYGGLGAIPIKGHNEPSRKMRYVKLVLQPMQFVILKASVPVISD